MIDRAKAWKILARHITDEIVVSTYSSASDWIATVDRPLNYFSNGAMGLASSHGLGLALARPERKVVVLDGDGSLLMNLGTLVTIGAVAPKNFIHFVGKNGSYEANGGHPIPNRAVDLPGIARAAGIAKAYELSTLGEFEARIGGLLAEDGPVFVCLDIEQGPLSAREYSEMYKASRRAALREALGAA
jgi:thiamine pyrophosphate-dependent acetolactate synthase large subunit-like protein